MSQVLYRKYRSKNFNELFGQTAVKAVLIQAIKDKRVSHAYLFSGPRGTGKTSTARILAKALNCTNKSQDGYDPCNNCISCNAINEGRFLDLIEIDAASNRGIDEIRDLKEKVSFLPAEGSYKIYIIDEVHMLTTEAFNALLKTLEEPPQKVVFILATTEPHKLPLTVISRTQRLDFKLATHEELKDKLEFILKQEKFKLDDGALDLVINAGNGSFRDAETVLEKVLASFGHKTNKQINVKDVEQILGLASFDQIESLLVLVLNKQIKDAIDLYRNLIFTGLDQNQLIKQVLEFVRLEMIKVISKESSSFSMKFISKIITEFSRAGQDMKYTLVSDLPIELALINISGIVNDQISETKLAPEVTRKIAEVQSNSIDTLNRTHDSKSIDKVIKNDIVDKDMSRCIHNIEIDSVVGSDKQAIVSKKNKIVSDQEKKKSINESIKKVSNNNISVDDVKKKWRIISEGAKEVNHHLAAFLMKAKVVGVEEKIIIHVPFSFHKKKLEQAKTQKIINKLTLESLGYAFDLKCIIDKDIRDEAIKEDKFVPPSKDNSNADMVEDVFEDF